MPCRSQIRQMLRVKASYTEAESAIPSMDNEMGVRILCQMKSTYVRFNTSKSHAGGKERECVGASRAICGPKMNAT